MKGIRKWHSWKRPICMLLAMFMLISQIFVQVPSIAYAAEDPEITSNGFDLKQVDGAYVILTGKGGYMTSNTTSTLGTEVYKMTLSSDTVLTKDTLIQVGQPAQGEQPAMVVTGAEIVLSELVAGQYLDILVTAGSSARVTVYGSNAIRNITLEAGASLTLRDYSTAASSLSAGSIIGTDAEVICEEVTLTLSGNVQAKTIQIIDSDVAGSETTVVEAETVKVQNSVIQNTGGGRIQALRVTEELDLNASTVKAQQIGAYTPATEQSSAASITEQNSTLDAELIGALDQATYVTFVQFNPTLTNINAERVWDYPVTYYNYGEAGYEKMAPTADTVVAYRVKQTGSNYELLGYFMSDGTLISSDVTVAKLDEILQSESATRENYQFLTWNEQGMDDQSDAASDKTNEQWLEYNGLVWDETTHQAVAGDGLTKGYTSFALDVTDPKPVNLYAVYSPDLVIVKVHTNTEKLSEGNEDNDVFAWLPMYIGAQGKSLEYLYQMDVIKKQEATAIAIADADKITVDTSYYTVTSATQTDLYIIWNKGNIKLALGFEKVDDACVYQYKDAEGNWITLQSTTADGLGKELTEEYSLPILTIGDFYPVLPELRAIKAADIDAEDPEIMYTFLGWGAIQADQSVTMIDTTVEVSTDLMTQTEIDEGVQGLKAQFENPRYTLTIPKKYADSGKWSFYDAYGNAIAFTDNGNDTMSIQIESGKAITVKRSATDTFMAYWRFKAADGSMIWPEEKVCTHATGTCDCWLEYSFVMPKQNVTATFGGSNGTTTSGKYAPWDTVWGDYEFGTFTINNRESYGIKITADNGDVSYHRWFMTDNATEALFVSEEETDNQIMVDAAITLYLDGVQLGQRGNVVSDLEKFYTSSAVNGLNKKDYCTDFSIFIDNDPSVPKTYNSGRDVYPVTIHVLGDGKVFSIGQRTWHKTVMSDADSKFYSNTLKIDLKGHVLQTYAVNVQESSSGHIKNGTVDVLTTTDTAVDKTIHWFHANSSGFAFDGVTVNGAQRDMFCRRGGSIENGGNGTSFNIKGGSVLKDVHTIHSPFLRTENATIHAKNLYTISYGFQITDSIINVEVMAFAGNVHVGYNNDDSYIKGSSVVTVSDWMSVDRFNVEDGATLKVAHGLHVFEHLIIKGAATVVEVGSLEKFQTISPTTGVIKETGDQCGTHYTGANEKHYFYVDIDEGATVTVTGNGVAAGEKVVDLGVDHVSMPQIKIHGSNTKVDVTGDADLYNSLQVYDGGQLSVDGNLYLHQNLTLSETGTINVTGNLYHHNAEEDMYNTITNSEGVSEKLYWTFTVDPQATLTVGGNFGSDPSLATARTNVILRDTDEDQIQIAGDVLRDIQVIYTMPDGFENHVDNQPNIRLVNEVSDTTVVLKKPDNIGSSPLQLSDDCWFYDSDLITGWETTKTTGTEIELADIQTLYLTAKPTDYALSVYYDNGAIQALQYRMTDADAWAALELPAVSGGAVLVPIGAQVKVTTASGYEQNVLVESYSNGSYGYVAGVASAGADTTFLMSEVQMNLHVQDTMTLYLDEGNIYVREDGFGRYTDDATRTVKYRGNILVTQKDPNNLCNNTVFVQYAVAADEQKLTITGINIKNDDGTTVHTIEIADKKLDAHIHLAGTNNFRNIVVKKGSHLHIHGASDATTTFVKSDYFSVNYSGSNYMTLIGHQSGGNITLEGGKYVANYNISSQGVAIGIGGSTGTNKVVLKGVELVLGATPHRRGIYLPGGTVEVIDSTITASMNSALFVAKDVIVSGDSVITTKTTTGYGTAFSSVTGSVTLKDQTSVVETTATGMHFWDSSDVVLNLQDDVKYSTTANIILNTINVSDNAVMEVKELTGTYGRLIAAKEINISGGSVTCGHLLASGYMNSEITYGDLFSNYNANSGITAAGKINITGGSVTAIGSDVLVTENTKEYLGGIIGGSRGVDLDISGTTNVTATTIGSCQYVFGSYREYNGVVKDLSFTGADVDVTGSDAVVVAAELGGLKSTVDFNDVDLVIPENSSVTGAQININGTSSVQMSSGSVIGCDGAAIVVKDSSDICGHDGALGAIVAHNGTLTIQDTASAHLGRIDVTDGTVVISTSSNKYMNPYDYITTDSANVSGMPVGVLVDYGGVNAPEDDVVMGTHAGDFAAEDITITSVAGVSAYRIGSNQMYPGDGLMKMEAHARLYTCLYGPYGSGDITLDIDQLANINGELQHSIYYNYGDLPAGTEVIMSEDADYFWRTTTSDHKDLTLGTPYAKGYRFEGWYFIKSDGTMDTQQPDSTILTTARNADIRLMAKWSPVTVWIQYSFWDGATQDADSRWQSRWQSFLYTDATIKHAEYVKEGFFGATTEAEAAWASVLYNGANVKTGVSYDIDPDLYDAYLKANGIVYEDGLDAAEIAQLAVIENLTASNVAGASFVPIQMKIFWTQASVKVSFKMGCTEVTDLAFTTGETTKIKRLDSPGTHAQDITVYCDNDYALNTLGEGYEAVPVPIRKGYDFLYWQWTDGANEFKLYADGTGINTKKGITERTTAPIVVDPDITALTAVYKAKNFVIQLIPEYIDDAVTHTGHIAGYAADHIYKLTVTYDQPVSQATLEITDANGNTVAKAVEDTFPTALPKAEIIGYVHDGWLLQVDGKDISVSAGTKWKWDATNPYDKVGYKGAYNTEVAHELTPDMHHTKITYEMNGGQWTDSVVAEGYPLLTVNSTQALPTVKYNESYSTEKRLTQYPIDTNGPNQIKRHGYRFIGWVDKVEYDLWIASNQQAKDYFKDANISKLIGHSTVTYTDETYYAVWQPCTYYVKLDSWVNSVGAWNQNAAAIGGTIGVTYQGGVISYGTQDANIVLPKRDDTRVLTHTRTSDHKVTTRQLLGWVFSGEHSSAVASMANVDPVMDYYDSNGEAKPNNDYAKFIVAQMNKGCLFEDGDTFELPIAVKDPGDGGELTLYAVYRERSLIFVDVRPDGTETVKAIADYDVDRGGYTEIDPAWQWDANEAKAQGYVLSGWYVNSKTPAMANDYTWYGLESAKHPNHSEYVKTDGAYVYRKDQTAGTYSMAEYQSKTASSTYDIYVYSFYAPQVTMNYNVYATAGKATSVDDIQTVPDSLAVDLYDSGVNIVYSVDTSDFKGTLVGDVSAITDASKFALELQKINDNGTVEGIILQPGVGQESNLYIKNGVKLKVAVHNSILLDKAEDLGTVKVEIKFPKLEGAVLTLNINLDTKQAIYIMDMKANVPTATSESFNSITGWAAGDSQYGEDTKRRDFYYGDNASELPQLKLTGYTFLGWEDEKGDLITGNLNYAPTQEQEAAGQYLAQTITAQWERNVHTLTLDPDLEEIWKVKVDNVVQSPANGVYEIPYKAAVVFEKEVARPYDAYPEFIHGYANEAASTEQYSFTMPDEDISLTFDRVKELDIADGSVVICDSDYTQNGQKSIWRGDYVLTGTSAINTIQIQTSNELAAEKIRHDITLSDLICTTHDGISVDTNISALTIGVKNTAGKSNQLKNIVAQETKLTLANVSGSASASLAAVEFLLTTTGDSGTLTMPAIDGKEIVLDGVSVHATATSQAATYNGVAFAADQIMVKNKSQVLMDADSAAPLGANVGLVSSAASLLVDDSEVISYMSVITSGNLTVQNDAEITMNNMNGKPADVTVGTIKVSDTAELTAANARITGEQTIDASAYVMDMLGRHLDVKAGSIQISDDACVQDGVTKSEQISYVLVGGKATSTTIDVDASEGAKASMIYADDIHVGAVTCQKTMNLYLVQDAQMTSLTGADESEVKIATYGSGTDKKTLTATGDVIANTLAVEDCVLNADGHSVGSNGTTLGQVTLTDADVTAAIVGATGEYGTSFTLVTVDSQSEVTGQLVRDWYRIAYDVGSYGALYDASKLPRSFRTTQTDHDGGVTVVGPESMISAKDGIPAAPISAINPSRFVVWYRMSGANSIAIATTIPADYTNVFSGAEVLTTGSIAYAKDTVDASGAKDGTKTLKLYGFFGASGEASIHAGRQFVWTDVAEKDLDKYESVEINRDMAWTAQFHVYGAVTGESRFQVAFTEELPAGTNLTLAVKDGNRFVYYYYKVETATKTVPLDEFVQMGTTGTAPVFANGEYEFMLAADFAKATTEPVDSDVTLQLVINGNVLDMVTVSYEVEAPAVTAITIQYGTGSSAVLAESKIEGTIRHSGKDAYAIVVFDNQLPLNAVVTLDGHAGKIIGGRSVWFDLGVVTGIKSDAYVLACENLREGVNVVKCYLAIVDESVPVNDDTKLFINATQYGTEGSLTIQAVKVEPKMMVTIVTVDGVETTSRIIKGGSQVVFDIVDNVKDIHVSVETVVGDSAAQWLTYNADTKTVMIAEGIPAGVYVVTFSFADHIYDDVSFSFVVK